MLKFCPYCGSKKVYWSIGVDEADYLECETCGKNFNIFEEGKEENYCPKCGKIIPEEYSLCQFCEAERS